MFGLFLSLFYVYFYFIGGDILLNVGFSSVSAQVVIHIYTVAGILMFSAYLILLIASISHNESLILLYQWTVVLFSIVDFIVISYISVILIINNDLIFGIVFFFLTIFNWIFFYLLIFPVINGFRRSIHTIVIVLA